MTAIGEALGRLQPVTAHAARGLEDASPSTEERSCGTVRRRCMRPAGDTNVMYVEGPATRKSPSSSSKVKARPPVAALLHFTSHPCHGVERQTIAGGWPGSMVRRMKPLLSAAFPWWSTVLRECAPAESDRTGETKTYQEMGRILTADAKQIMEKPGPRGRSRCCPPSGSSRFPCGDLDVVKVREAGTPAGAASGTDLTNAEKTQID